MAAATRRKYQTTEFRMAEASVWSRFHTATEEGLPSHRISVLASSRSRTPASSPMRAWNILKVEQGVRRISLCASLITV